LTVGSVLLLAFITPALTVGAISGERERRTLDLLLITRASALGLVSGKLLASLVYVLYLLAASLPAFALVYLFGGVPWPYLALALAVAAVTAVTHAALGLFLSALLRRTALASVVSYLLVLVLVFGLPFASVVSGLTGGPGDPSVSAWKGGAPPAQNLPPVYVYASPLTSAVSVQPAATSGVYLPFISGVLAVSSIGRYGGPYSSMSVAVSPTTSITQAVIVTGVNPTTGEPQTATTWAPWIYHFAISAVLTVLCLLGAALAATPIKPWQGWRARLRRRPQASEVGKA
jgi:ABC-type transport system involved in multi-copper enzyme maturation permease subunit